MSSPSVPSGFSSIGRPSISANSPPTQTANTSAYGTQSAYPSTSTSTYSTSSTSAFQSAYDSPASQSSGELIHCEIPRYEWIPPSDFANFPYRPHLGNGAQQLREFILGINQGLLSTFLLVVAVAGGSKDAKTCLLAALAGAVAGSLAVGIAQLVSVSSQLTVNRRELELEMEHFKYHRDVELEQLRNFLKNINLSGNLLECVVSEIGRNDESLLKVMMAFESGVQSQDFHQSNAYQRHPIIAMLNSMKLYLISSIPTIFPFLFIHSAGIGLIVVSILVGIFLFAVGAYKTKTTKGNPWVDGLINFLVGAACAAIAYLVGYAFDSSRNNGMGMNNTPTCS